MKKNVFILFCLFAISWGSLRGQNSLPSVFAEEDLNDVVASVLRLKAEKASNRLQVIDEASDWFREREGLRKKIVENANIAFHSGLPLDYHETGSHKLEGYTVKNIFFQTRPRIYATANLYVPDGEGPFPAAVVMIGHSPPSGKMADEHQSLGHTLARNGYVAISIDPWGAGERGTVPGEFDYHGANLGSSLLNVGETLMGMQVTDNMRAVDLLCSFPFVDAANIGATGASGGGNQTMWLAAVDERIKAAVPVVSVGTFQSYILNSNCICETLIDGLTFTEESSVLGLIAPRALKICNGLKESNRAFYPQEMLRSFRKAQAIYRYYNAGSKLSYQIFDTPHGYYPEMRETMLGWFDLHLKNQGTGAPKREEPFSVLPESALRVFPEGNRFPNVVSTGDFCFNRGKELREEMFRSEQMDVEEKKEGLRNLLKIPGSKLEVAHKLTNSGNWERYVLETTSGDQVPALIYSPTKNSAEYVLLCNSEGKSEIPEKTVETLIQKKHGICIVDLWGIGENRSAETKRMEGGLPEFHTLFRSALWLGTTMQGIWMNQLEMVSDWLSSFDGVQKITIDANRELAVAGLFFSSLENKTDKLILRDMPLSYCFDKSGNINYFSMAIHLPGFLKWGDISLAAALSGKEIYLANPKSIAGRALAEEEIKLFEEEFNFFGKLLGRNSRINFLK